LQEETHIAEYARKLGLPAEVLDAQATAELEPDVRLDVCGAVHYPLDCQLNPADFVRGMQSQLARYDCEFQFDSEVTGLELCDGRLRAVRTVRGELPADDVVLAGGVWSQEFARRCGVSLPLQAGKGYSLTLEQPRQRPRLCAVLSEARVAVTPMGTSLRLGGTMEIAGLDESIRVPRIQGIVNSVRRYYPAFEAADFQDIVPWRGLRPCSPDGLPYLGRTREIPNLVVATGHAMMGISLAPITGRLVAELLAQERPSFDLSLLSPDRYG
jgi:D-amino-acid dehydrogenase